MSTHSNALLRKPDVLRLTAFSATTLYKRVREGLFTKPIKIAGTSISVWPESEVGALNKAITAGKSTNQIKALVARLHGERPAADE